MPLFTGGVCGCGTTQLVGRDSRVEQPKAKKNSREDKDKEASEGLDVI